MAHLNNFTLFVATPDQIIEHRKRTYARWGKGHYTLEEYLSVFEALEHQEHSADGRSKTWLAAHILLYPRLAHHGQGART